ncbi:glycosyltransferase family 61 protein [Capillimicrobium parvum]|uniref:Glycosyltransferase 61 catalytic domain-containing protein n=1 Tax=Capillimicrobium parvum TaxID=2884022 RepID=A0A9E7C2G5_9ACTN|nr:glycosyltransferase family 61 protein [Capillimicrobium parvum]UGS37617.1 hypothetical protein DSM104329_04035 [Capillimicrobium parvum]
MIDAYDDYLQVGSVAEVTGPGNRWFEADPEPSLAPPAGRVLGGESRLELRTDRAATRLRLVKVRNALVLPGRLIVNTANDRLLYDALREPVRSGDQLDARTRERLHPLALDRQLDSDRLVRLPGQTFCLAVRTTRQPFLLLEGLSQLWPAAELDMSQMHVAVNPMPGLDDLLAPFGIAPERIVELTSAPVLCEELLLATPAVVLPRRLSPRFWDVMGRLRDAYPPPPDAPRRVYLSRAAAEERVLLNEPEVEELFRGHDFDVVADRELHGAELVRRVGAAEWIAAPVGAGVGTAFAPLGVRRIVLAPDLYDTPLETLLGVEHGPLHLYGRSLATVPKAAAVEDWSIDPEIVGGALEDLFGGERRGAAVVPAEDDRGGSRRWRGRALERLRRGREARAAASPIEVEVAVPTDVPPEALFALLDDLRAFTRAEPRLQETAWEPDAGVQPGARAHLETSVAWVLGLAPLIGRPEATVVVEEVERPSRLCLGVEAPVAHAGVQIDVTAAGSGHVVRARASVQLAGIAAVAPLDRGVRRAARRYAAPSLNRVVHSFIAQARERVQAA